MEFGVSGIHQTSQPASTRPHMRILYTIYFRIYFYSERDSNRGSQECLLSWENPGKSSFNLLETLENGFGYALVLPKYFFSVYFLFFCFAFSFVRLFHTNTTTYIYLFFFTGWWCHNDSGKTGISLPLAFPQPHKMIRTPTIYKYIFVVLMLCSNVNTLHE